MQSEVKIIHIIVQNNTYFLRSHILSKLFTLFLVSTTYSEDFKRFISFPDAGLLFQRITSTCRGRVFWLGIHFLFIGGPTPLRTRHQYIILDRPGYFIFRISAISCEYSPIRHLGKRPREIENFTQLHTREMIMVGEQVTHQEATENLGEQIKKIKKWWNN